MVTHRLRELNWEVLVADESFTVSTNAEESQMLERRSRQHIIALPNQLQREMLARGGIGGVALKPWEKLVPHRSLPAMPKLATEKASAGLGSAAKSTSMDASGQAGMKGSISEDTYDRDSDWPFESPDGDEEESAERDLPTDVEGRAERGLPTALASASLPTIVPHVPPLALPMLTPQRTPKPAPLQFSQVKHRVPAATEYSPSPRAELDYAQAARSGPRRHASMGGKQFQFDSPGTLATLATLGEGSRPRDTQTYAQSMRLLWLAAGMKNLDVILVILRTDREVLEVCSMISDMLPMIERSRKRTWSRPPQLIVSMQDDSLLQLMNINPKPLVIGPGLALPRLICEVRYCVQPAPPISWHTSLRWPSSQSGAALALTLRLPPASVARMPARAILTLQGYAPSDCDCHRRACNPHARTCTQAHIFAVCSRAMLAGCSQVLHPSAHYTGTFESSPLDTMDAVSEISDLMMSGETSRARRRSMEASPRRSHATPVPAMATSPRRSSCSAAKGSMEAAPPRRGPLASRTNKSKLPVAGAVSAPTTPGGTMASAPAPSARASLKSWAAGLMQAAHASAAPPPFGSSGTLSAEAGAESGYSPRYQSVSGTSTPRGSDFGDTPAGTPGTGDVPPALWRARSARRDGERFPGPMDLL
jgi:hypothetical protein